MTSQPDQKTALQLYRERLEVVYTESTAISLCVDVQGQVTSIPGQGPRPGQLIAGLQVKDDFVARLSEPHRAPFRLAIAGIASGGGSTENDVLLDTGEWLRLKIVRLPTTSGVPQILVLATDITMWKTQESLLSQLATHDALTGLPNRRLLLDRISQQIVIQSRHPALFTLLLLDLDGFKRVNDTLGHAAGDVLLQEVAQRITRVARDSDTVARLGGDEFVVLLPETANVTDVQSVATRIANAIKQPYSISGELVHVSASIGAAMFPEHGDTPGELLKNADSAMYQAKAAGRDQCMVHDPNRDRGVKTLSMISEMHEGLEQGEFSLVYQPIFSPDRKLLGCESLMRWTKRDGTSVPPIDFIPLAESDGLITLLGGWALRTACAQGLKFATQLGYPCYVAVNVSPQQFMESRFYTRVVDALSESGLPPGNLVLEITEGVLMRDPAKANKVLTNLAAMGIKISIDDFGTGYSSLSYLKRFPVSALKIDRSFVTDLESDQADRAIVMAILGMANALGIQSVAEGVETDGQLEFLAANGCTHIQGWLTGKPVAAEMFSNLYLR